jgi:hypothetical protein
MLGLARRLQTLAQTAQQGQQVHGLRLQHMALGPIQLQQAVEHGRHALGGLVHGLQKAARLFQVLDTRAGDCSSSATSGLKASRWRSGARRSCETACTHSCWAVRKAASSASRLASSASASSRD